MKQGADIFQKCQCQEIERKTKEWLQAKETWHLNATNDPGVEKTGVKKDAFGTMGKI